MAEVSIFGVNVGARSTVLANTLFMPPSVSYHPWNGTIVDRWAIRVADYLFYCQ